MPRWLYYVATFGLALVLTIVLIPKIRAAAIQYGILDRPDEGLKKHKEPVPYLGGVGLYLAFLITLALVFDFQPQLLGLLLGGTIIATLGLFDDLHAINVRLKLAGQALAVWVLLKCGISIQIASLPEWLSIVLTVGWVIGMTNAINIIDVSDGLSSSVASVAALALFCVAALNGEVLIATTTLALVGALVGFLKFNQPPATIYMGDAGSLFVGFMLAALSMIGSYTQSGLLRASAPLLILIVPLLETTLVSIARIAKGMSPTNGSPDHFAIRLKHKGWSARKVALYGAGLGVFGGSSGIAMIVVGEQTATYVAIAGAVVFIGNLIWLLRTPAPN